MRLCNTVLGASRMKLDFISVHELDHESEKKLSLSFLEDGREETLYFEPSTHPAPCFAALSEFYLDRFSSLSGLYLSFYKYKPPGISYSSPRSHLEICTPHSCGVFVGPATSAEISSLHALLGCFEFFINCELTFLSLLKVIKNAKSRNRQDVYQKACTELSELTTINSYEILKEKP
mgnify:CR=1 FL=1